MSCLQRKTCRIRQIGVLAFVTCLAAFATVAQSVPETTPLDPDLVSSFDYVAQVFAEAGAKLEENRSDRVIPALGKASATWEQATLYYRDWPTPDPAWVGDFDAIGESLKAAEEAYVSRLDEEKAAVELAAARERFDALRERNGVPDISGALSNVAQSLNAVAKSVQSGRQGADPAGMAQSVSSAIESWQNLINVVVHANMLGLERDKLDKLERLADAQNQRFNSVKNNLNGGSAYTLMNDLREALEAVTELGNTLREAQVQEAEDEGLAQEGDPKEPANKSRQRRPGPLLRLLFPDRDW